MTTKEYNTILLALAFQHNEEKVITRADELKNQFGAELILVHAIEHLGGCCACAAGVVANLEAEALTEAAVTMRKFGKRLGVAKENQIVEIGSSKMIILEQAEKTGSDLIIVGNRYHGCLFGSTASTVLDKANCDVTAIRLE